MDSFKLRTDSWHFKVFSWYRYLSNHDYTDYFVRYLRSDFYINVDDYKDGDDPKYFNTVFTSKLMGPNNFCSYWRGVLFWPLLQVLSDIAILAAFIYVQIKWPWGTIIGTLVVAAIMAVIIGLALGIKWLWSVWQDRGCAPTVSCGFLETVYWSIKKKICPLIEFVEVKSEEKNS